MSTQSFYSGAASSFASENSTAYAATLDSGFVTKKLNGETRNRSQYLAAVAQDFADYSFSSVVFTVNGEVTVGSTIIAFVTREFTASDGTNTIVSRLNTVDELVASGSTFLITKSYQTGRQFTLNGVAKSFAEMSTDTALMQACADEWEGDRWPGN